MTDTNGFPDDSSIFANYIDSWQHFRLNPISIALSLPLCTEVKWYQQDAEGCQGTLFRVERSCGASSTLSQIKATALKCQDDVVHFNDFQQSAIQALIIRVEYLELGRGLLLLGYGSFVAEIRNPTSLEIMRRFDSATLSSFGNPTRCLGANFVKNAVFDGNQVWIGLAFQSCADPSLNYHIVWFEINQSVEVLKSQSIRFPRSNMRFVNFCNTSSDTLILGVTDEQKVWTYRQEIKSSFAGPMYPPGFIVLNAISEYTEREDELDQSVLNGYDIQTMVMESEELDEEIVLEDNRQSPSHEMALKRLPSNIASYASMDESAFAIAESPLVDASSLRSMLPIPQKLSDAGDTPRREKDIRLREDIVKASKTPVLDTRMALLIKASYDAAQKEQEKRLRARWRRVSRTIMA